MLKIKDNRTEGKVSPALVAAAQKVRPQCPQTPLSSLGRLWRGGALRGHTLFCRDATSQSQGCTFARTIFHSLFTSWKDSIDLGEYKVFSPFSVRRFHLYSRRWLHPHVAKQKKASGIESNLNRNTLPKKILLHGNATRMCQGVPLFCVFTRKHTTQPRRDGGSNSRWWKENGPGALTHSAVYGRCITNVRNWNLSNVTNQ